jgi:hypothetical protein
MRADLRHLTLVEIGEALEELVRERELEYRVAEELEPFIRVGAFFRPARMGERVGRALRRERVDQLAEGLVFLTGAR